MVPLCSYVPNSDFPRADESPDEREFHVNMLAPRCATWIIRDRLCALVIAKISTRMPLSSGGRKTKTVLVNNASLDASHRATYSASQVAVVHISAYYSPSQ